MNIKRITRYITIISRAISECIILFLMYQETGPWTLFFGVCVTIAIELQVIWNTIQNKTNTAIVELIATGDVASFLGQNNIKGA